ncbi:baseplate J/gp47 family protein [Loigolactobacillus bifermentans]|uniref:Baseplate protein J-like barrel domain-containing protein n=1 Tax=Loigolactobacillus bifermentans DSM 20003 TaxID=1423726 RepID=A0A0R1H318_9LACO|nr:baseplate J/gp47 family protein [Loigolactobacillus bifermentans]KRK40789.1 hypothetical protein FC07_GL002538 [Loigolactobacillus bifermentans DSM 20003]QGG59541.1 hypothetical protein LB003_03075 [Loigolactobacillus bifermentans]
MLDENGFTRPTYDELIQTLIQKWQELFGENANVAPNSVGGIFIRVLAFFLNQIYQLAELVYQSQFADSATGTTLDQLAANLGLVRQAPQAAIGEVQIYGVAGYVVPAGTLFQTDDGLIYVTSEDITLADQGKTSIDTGDLGQGVLQYNDKNIGLGTSTVLYANGTGSNYNKPGVIGDYIAQQLMPVEEVLLVEVGKITGGADLEDDDALRDRLEQASQEAPSSPYNGVMSAVRDVVGVSSAKIVVNDTMDTDASGNPAKTLHIYVDGGNQDDIGAAIFDSIAAGIQTYGSIEVYVKDIGGSTHSVYYDQPTAIQIFASVAATTNEAFPLDGNAQIQQAVVDYVRSVGMGGTIHYSYLYKYLYDNITGLDVADVKIGTDKDNLTAADIPLTDIQRATITTDTVVVA